MSGFRRKMRRSTLIALFLLPVVLLAATTPLSSSAQETPIFVRVNGERVHFRESLPQTQEREDIERYADPKATYVAYDRKQGEVSGYSGDWLWLANQARDERGWVAARYVEVINPADKARLEKLGSSPEKSDSLWLQLLNNVVGITSGLVAIAAALISIVTSKLIERVLKYLGRARPSGQAKENTVSRRETSPFPRAVPPPPPPVGPSSRQEPPIIYGISGGSVWIHRTRKRQQ